MAIPQTILRSEKHAQQIWQKAERGIYEDHQYGI